VPTANDPRTIVPVPSLGSTDAGRQWCVPAVAVIAGYGVATVALLAESWPRLLGSVASSTPSWEALALAAGLMNLVAGAVGVREDYHRLGLLTSVVGAVGIAPVWVGWASGLSTIPPLGAAFGAMLVPVLAHLAALPRPRDGIRGSRVGRLLLGAYAVSAAAGSVRAATLNPLRVARCELPCSGAGAARPLWDAPDVAHAADVCLAVLAVVVAAAATVGVSHRLRSPLVGPQFVVAVAVPATIALLVTSVRDVVVLEGVGGADAEDGLFVCQSVALAALATGVGWLVVGLGRAHRRVATLALQLGADPEVGELETALARSLRDPSLEVRFVVPGTGRLVAADGVPAPVAPGDPRAAVSIVRDGVPVALVLHDARRVASDELKGEVGAAARLVIDNERLRAVSLARIHELVVSRGRIVDAGEAYRRRAERDLHDGAQQMLLAVGHELRSARTEASGEGHQPLGEELAAAESAASAALDHLRELAHGLFPTLLEAAGLEEALLSLSDASRGRLEVSTSGLDGVSLPAARVAYRVARAAADSGPVTGRPVVVRARREGDALVVEVSGSSAIDSLYLADHVGAAGGELTVEGSMIRAVIPCAS